MEGKKDGFDQSGAANHYWGDARVIHVYSFSILVLPTTLGKHVFFTNKSNN